MTGNKARPERVNTVKCQMIDFPIIGNLSFDFDIKMIVKAARIIVLNSHVLLRKIF